mgnify:CR=1 FL=1
MRKWRSCALMRLLLAGSRVAFRCRHQTLPELTPLSTWNVVNSAHKANNVCKIVSMMFEDAAGAPYSFSKDPPLPCSTHLRLTTI